MSGDHFGSLGAADGMKALVKIRCQVSKTRGRIERYDELIRLVLRGLHKIAGDARLVFDGSGGATHDPIDGTLALLVVLARRMELAS